MKTSLVYRHPLIYEGVMSALYGAHYFKRLRSIAELIPPGTSVVELCCGPGTLYRRHLSYKRVSYVGLDLNAGFIRQVNRAGGKGLLWDVSQNVPLPQADFALMQASLYHFQPDPIPVLIRMLAAARIHVIVAEPIRNLADSQVRLLSFAARKMTNPGTGLQEKRFNEKTLDALFEHHRLRGHVSRSFHIAGGREKVYVLEAERA